MSGGSPISLSDRLLTLICVIAILVPAFLAAHFIYRYSYNTLLADDFWIMAGVGDLLDGKLPLTKLLEPHNEHRAFFGKAVFLGLGLLTGFNSVAQLYLNWGFIAFTLLVLALINIQIAGPGRLAMLLCAADSMLLFSLRNYETLLVGADFNSMAIFFLVVSLTMLVKAVQSSGSRSASWCLLAAACAVMSTFSGMIAALVVWPLGLIVLTYGAAASAPGSRRMILLSNLAVWLLLTTASVAAYFFQYDRIVWHQAIPVFQQSWKLLKVGTTLVGSALFGDVETALAGGIILLAITALVLVAAIYRGLRLKLDAGALPSICLVLFALSSVLLITLGRAGQFGVAAAMAPRYAQFGAVGICGLLGILALGATGHERTRHLLIGGIFGLVWLGYIQSLERSTAIGRQWLDERKKNAYYLRTYRMQSDEGLWSLGVPPVTVRDIAEVCEARRFNVFAEQREHFQGLARAALRSGCSVDKFTDSPLTIDRLTDVLAAGPFSYRVEGRKLARMLAEATVTQSRRSAKSGTGALGNANGRKAADDSGLGSTIEVSGWAFDPERKAPSPAVFLKIGDKGEVPVCYGLARPDVAGYFRSNSLIDCGFYACFSSRHFEPGVYPVSLMVLSADRRKVFESLPFRTITIEH